MKMDNKIILKKDLPLLGRISKQAKTLKLGLIKDP